MKRIFSILRLWLVQDELEYDIIEERVVFKNNNDEVLGAAQLLKHVKANKHM